MQVDTSVASVKVYRGLHHALTEVCIGLTQQFPHKKKAFYLEALSPFISRPMKQLSINGYQVISKPKELLKDSESFTNSLGKEDLFCLYSDDDPLLGVCHDVERLEGLLGEKKVFSLRISHNRFLSAGFEKSPGPMHVQILQLSRQYCVVISGLRARVPDLISGGLTWTEEDLTAIVSGFNKKLQEDEAAVKHFEAHLPEGARTLIPESAQRLYDRSVFYWSDMDGHAFIHYLNQMSSSKPLFPPGESPLMEACSRSRWGEIKYFDWLMSSGVKPEALRGLVVLDASQVKESQLSLIQATREQVLALQTG